MTQATVSSNIIQRNKTKRNRHKYLVAFIRPWKSFLDNSHIIDYGTVGLNLSSMPNNQIILYRRWSQHIQHAAQKMADKKFRYAHFEQKRKSGSSTTNAKIFIGWAQQQQFETASAINVKRCWWRWTRQDRLVVKRIMHQLPQPRNSAQRDFKLIASCCCLVSETWEVLWQIQQSAIKTVSTSERRTRRSNGSKHRDQCIKLGNKLS